MTPRQAPQILREAVERSNRETVQTPEVREALETLARFGPTRTNVDGQPFDAWPIRQFWDCADSAQVGRQQNVRASFKGLLRQLGLPDE